MSLWYELGATTKVGAIVLLLLTLWEMADTSRVTEHLPWEVRRHLPTFVPNSFFCTQSVGGLREMCRSPFLLSFCFVLASFILDLMASLSGARLGLLWLLQPLLLASLRLEMASAALVLTFLSLLFHHLVHVPVGTVTSTVAPERPARFSPSLLYSSDSEESDTETTARRAAPAARSAASSAAMAPAAKPAPASMSQRFGTSRSDDDDSDDDDNRGAAMVSSQPRPSTARIPPPSSPRRHTGARTGGPGVGVASAAGGTVAAAANRLASAVAGSLKPQRPAPTTPQQQQHQQQQVARPQYRDSPVGVAAPVPVKPSPQQQQHQQQQHQHQQQHDVPANSYDSSSDSSSSDEFFQDPSTNPYLYNFDQVRHTPPSRPNEVRVLTNEVYFCECVGLLCRI